jgi:hypothetical protein
MTQTNQNQNQNEPTRRLIPEGKYRVKAVEAVFGEASTGTEQIGVLLEVVDGDHKGTLLTWYGYFSEAAEERTIQSMRYLGWKGVDITDLSSMYAGQEAQADIEHDTDQEGKTRAKVQWINGIGMKKKMEGAQLASFAKRIRGVAARVGGAAAGGASSGMPPMNRSNGNGNGRRDDAPPPDDRDAPPWGGNRGGQQGGYRR